MEDLRHPKHPNQTEHFDPPNYIWNSWMQNHSDHNTNPKPFIWTASAGDILAKVMRAKAALDRVSR
jgi:hypothetical protein